MKIEFMVEDNAYYNSDMEYTIVESYYPEDYGIHGYDIYRVETDNISDIRVIFGNGTEYEAEEAIPFKDGNETIYSVSIWKPVV
jgi:hypothetical protein